jgi:hypothetical protein
MDYEKLNRTTFDGLYTFYLIMVCLIDFVIYLFCKFLPETYCMFLYCLDKIIFQMFAHRLV